MRVGVHAVGRMKSSPERDLADRYLDRFAKLGPSLGLEFGGVEEHAESRAASAELRRRDEAERLAARIPTGATRILLDERGKNIKSHDFALRVAALRDAGTRNLVLVIGGPDGVDPAFSNTAELVLSFGAQTWPHQLVRILAGEQLYRAATILSGHPYHRA